MDGLELLRANIRAKATMWSDYILGGQCQGPDDYSRSVATYRTLVDMEDEITEVIRKLAGGE